MNHNSQPLIARTVCLTLDGLCLKKSAQGKTTPVDAALVRASAQAE